MQSNTPYSAENFLAAIKSMNGMYELPINESPRIYSRPDEFQAKLEGFYNTLKDEVEEITEIMTQAEFGTEIQILTSLSDLLGDIVVYCFSEALKYGIPLMEVLRIIMESNKSKLDTDGKPIKNEHGKFLKGPNYWKPEPKIEDLLREHIEDMEDAAIVRERQGEPTVPVVIRDGFGAGFPTPSIEELTEVYSQSPEELLAKGLPPYKLEQVPSIETTNQAVAMLQAHSELSTEVPNCSALFALHVLSNLDGHQFNHQLREHLTTNQIEKLAMTLAFNTAATYRAMGANGIAQAYDGLYSNYSGRGDKLDDFSCFIMWQFLDYGLTWENITDKLVELAIYG